MGFIKNAMIKSATKSTVNSALKYINGLDQMNSSEAAMVWLETRPSSLSVKMALDLIRKFAAKTGLDESQDAELIITEVLKYELTDYKQEETQLMQGIVKDILKHQL